MSRRTAREKAFKMLFAIDIGDNTIEEASEIVMYLMKNESHKLFILSVVRGVLENLSKIDELINKYSDDWSVNRMASTDRNILRLAIYEILYCQDIPVSVSINEAVEIAKKYGDEQSYKFINGLLGAIAKDISFK
ncbi:MAG TPA: transcription antitermination factor NusB [Thermoanaerobacterales bacterium]|nr:transcription antitermination factor NusB [Thermoanaerobacterales bacterium]